MRGRSHKQLTRMIVVATIAGSTAAMAQTPAPTAPASSHIALVLGNAKYQAGPLATPANDAGLIAQTLRAEGYDVSGAADVTNAQMVSAINDFFGKAAGLGPDGVAFIYLAGYGVQYNGEDYFTGVDAKIAKAADIPNNGVPLSALEQALTNLNLSGRVFVLDAARANPFAPGDKSVAGGLGLVDPPQGSLVAFNAAPGSVGPSETGSYGAYAQALAGALAAGGLSATQVFDEARLRASDSTKGAEIPWDASKITANVVFGVAPAGVPPAAQLSRLQNLPIANAGAGDAYAAALARDTMAGYEAFLSAYPNDPLAKRVRAILAARREARTWMEATRFDTPAAYWSYLRRYPNGPHAGDAAAALAELKAELAPPPSFAPVVFDVPPPPPPEIEYVAAPYVSFYNPAWDLPPPPPAYYLPPAPVFYPTSPPLPPQAQYGLPIVPFVAGAVIGGIVAAAFNNGGPGGQVNVQPGPGAGQGGVQITPMPYGKQQIPPPNLNLTPQQTINFAQAAASNGKNVPVIPPAGGWHLTPQQSQLSPQAIQWAAEHAVNKQRIIQLPQQASNTAGSAPAATGPGGLAQGLRLPGQGGQGAPAVNPQAGGQSQSGAPGAGAGSAQAARPSTLNPLPGGQALPGNPQPQQQQLQATRPPQNNLPTPPGTGLVANPSGAGGQRPAATGTGSPDLATLQQQQRQVTQQHQEEVNAAAAAAAAQAAQHQQQQQQLQQQHQQEQQALQQKQAQEAAQAAAADKARLAAQQQQQQQQMQQQQQRQQQEMQQRQQQEQQALAAQHAQQMQQQQQQHVQMMQQHVQAPPPPPAPGRPGPGPEPQKR